VLIEFLEYVCVVEALTRPLRLGGIERVRKAELSFRLQGSAYLVIIENCNAKPVSPQVGKGAAS
jgi:hypothetical protein